MESNLLKEAIADAKAVRQTALANAKVALEEAFSERYHAMFAEKLKEDAAFGNEPAAAPTQDNVSAEENVSEQEIDELIKELEAEVGGAQVEPDADDVAGATPLGAPAVPAGPVAPAVPPLPGAGVPPGFPPPALGAPFGAPLGAPAVPGVAPVPPSDAGFGAPAPMPPSDAGFGAPAPSPFGAPPVGAPPVGAPPSDVPAPEGSEEADEDVNLDELLESLKAEIEDCDETIDEQTSLASSGIGGGDNKKSTSASHSSSQIESGGLKQHGLPSPAGTKVGPEDATKATRPNQGKNATSSNLSTPSLGGTSGPALKASRPNCKGDIENTSKLEEQNETLKKHLAEALETVKYQKSQFNEINLLNSKLLYTNKLLKEYGLNNEQKMRVVELFDLASNVREVKLTYANIAESLSFSGKDMRRAKASASAQSITEGLASQQVGSTKPSKELISEGRANQMVTRFQQIAGIKPTKK